MKALDFIKQQQFLRGDKWIWLAYFGLCLFSFLEVYSASTRLTYSEGEFYAPALSHGTFLAVGLLVVWALHMIPYRLYYYTAGPIWGLGFILLMFTTVLGGTVNGASRWLSLGGFTVQPSEIAKLGLICWTAKIFSDSRDPETGDMTMKAFEIVFAIACATCIFIFSENFSTCVLTFVTVAILTFVCQPPKIFYYLTVVAVVVGITGLVGMKSISKEKAADIAEMTINVPFTDKDYHPLHRFPTWHNRFVGGQEIPENPKDYNIREDMQATHARLAVATGGLVGKGFGHSVERNYLPHAYSDFIFSIVLEEGGIWLPILIIIFYLIIISRSWVIAKRCKNRFPCYLVLGLALMLVSQALFNMAVAVDIFPITGQPLPLMSKGGTSTVITCSYLGMILSVSHTAAQKEKKAKKQKRAEIEA